MERNELFLNRCLIASGEHEEHGDSLGLAEPEDDPVTLQEVGISINHAAFGVSS